MQVTNDDAHFIEENMPIKVENEELSQSEHFKMIELQKTYN
jgi:cytochrome c